MCCVVLFITDTRNTLRRAIARCEHGNTAKENLTMNKSSLMKPRKLRKETIQDLKDAGYGLQVFYNPEPRTFSYDHYFTAVSKVLYNDEVEWTGKYYNRTDFTSIQGTKIGL